ncbi:hypothetical protein SBRY_20331 [Actinacidiphila bryophytorum]|uniref:Uncharacterized protein n=1 Tax=Actinacidiphila bryophytorum TaxID=1436133 RepID=A0A9W4E799_9ACTN|nr:hypothetical protein SBRY_20331 [Actinacidiphila bryophytorum]
MHTAPAVGQHPQDGQPGHPGELRHGHPALEGGQGVRHPPGRRPHPADQGLRLDDQRGPRRADRLPRGDGRTPGLHGRGAPHGLLPRRGGTPDVHEPAAARHTAAAGLRGPQDRRRPLRLAGELLDGGATALDVRPVHGVLHHRRRLPHVGALRGQGRHPAERVPGGAALHHLPGVQPVPDGRRARPQPLLRLPALGARPRRAREGPRRRGLPRPRRPQEDLCAALPGALAHGVLPAPVLRRRHTQGLRHRPGLHHLGREPGPGRDLRQQPGPAQRHGHPRAPQGAAVQRPRRVLVGADAAGRRAGGGRRHRDGTVRGQQRVLEGPHRQRARRLPRHDLLQDRPGPRRRPHGPDHHVALDRPARRGRRAGTARQPVQRHSQGQCAAGGHRAGTLVLGRHRAHRGAADRGPGPRRGGRHDGGHAAAHRRGARAAVRLPLPLRRAQEAGAEHQPLPGRQRRLGLRRGHLRLERGARRRSGPAGPADPARHRQSGPPPARLGRVLEVPAAPRRLARTLAALSESSE